MCPPQELFLKFHINKYHDVLYNKCELFTREKERKKDRLSNHVHKTCTNVDLQIPL